MLPGLGLQFNFLDDTVFGLIEIESFYCAKYFRANDLYSTFRNNVPNSIKTSKTWTKTMVSIAVELYMVTMVVSNKSCLLAYYYLLPVYSNKSEIIKLRLTSNLIPS